MNRHRKFRIVGAGFSGLTHAYYLAKLGCEVELFETSPRVGGLISSTVEPWGLVETAANGVLNSAILEDVAADIGVPFEPSRRESRARYILRDGHPRRWPLKIFETLAMIFWFLTARLRGGRAPRPHETVQTWGDRVFGQAFTRRLLAPALQGIYAADAARLSATLILGRFFGGGRRRSKERPPKVRGTVAPRAGLGAFLEGLAGWLKLQPIYRQHLAHPVSAEDIRDPRAHWIIATSAAAASRLVALRSPRLSELLSRIEMIPVTTVALAYPAGAGRYPGFGCLFPRESGYEVMGVLFNSFIFEDRGPGHSETWIFRGVAGRSESEWLDIIRKERARFYGEDVAPVGSRVTEWPEALPYYTCELEKLVPEIEREAKASGVVLVGNYLGRLSLSRMLEAAQTRAREICAE